MTKFIQLALAALLSAIAPFGEAANSIRFCGKSACESAAAPANLGNVSYSEPANAVNFARASSLVATDKGYFVCGLAKLAKSPRCVQVNFPAMEEIRFKFLPATDTGLLHLTADIKTTPDLLAAYTQSIEDFKKKLSQSRMRLETLMYADRPKSLSASRTALSGEYGDEFCEFCPPDIHPPRATGPAAPTEPGSPGDSSDPVNAGELPIVSVIASGIPSDPYPAPPPGWTGVETGDYTPDPASEEPPKPPNYGCLKWCETRFKEDRNKCYNYSGKRKAVCMGAAAVKYYYCTSVTCE